MAVGAEAYTLMLDVWLLDFDPARAHDPSLQNEEFECTGIAAEDA